MKINILCENQVGYDGAGTCLAEWGFSAFIQIKGVNILFDTGHTDVYWCNAKQLDVNIEGVDFVVLSHSHWDHTGGMQHHSFSEKKKLIAHPAVLEKLPTAESEKIKKDFDISPSAGVFEFAEGIYYLGEIPRKNTFEKGEHDGDAMLDDSAIAIKTEKGVVVVSGCSHSGICNICEYAKEVTGQKLHAVLGGFHLFENDTEEVNETIKYFKKEKPEHLYPLHCVDFPVLSKLHTEFGIRKLSVGDAVEFID